ncbi:MAG: ABC transporter permease [Treponema sp.]|nr:ABC transporter permease [Treponema sp.]MCL2250923.1 ABC transporter permease [Treponema sp.]
MKDRDKMQGCPPEAGFTAKSARFFRNADFSRTQNFSFSIFFIPLIGILSLILLVFFLSDTPLKTLYFFFIGPFTNLFSFGNMLNACVPLIFGALAVIIAMKAGNLNLGGEGQIYLSAFITLITALHLSKLGALGAFIAVIIGSLCAGVLAAFSGFCKAKWNTSELITTFLLSCAVIPIVNYLVTVPFLDPQTSLISTKKIAENMRLTMILKPSNLNTSVFIALIFVFIIHFFIYKTKMGYELRMTGFNEMFSRYGGINTKLNTVIALGFSGILYGLAGSISVIGTHYAVIKEFSAGLGWSGLTVALIACFSPAAVIPCAFFLAWINAGARIAMQNTGITFEVAYIVHSVIFFLSTSLLIKDTVTRNILNKRKR